MLINKRGTGHFIRTQYIASINCRPHYSSCCTTTRNLPSHKKVDRLLAASAADPGPSVSPRSCIGRTPSEPRIAERRNSFQMRDSILPVNSCPQHLHDNYSYPRIHTSKALRTLLRTPIAQPTPPRVLSGNQVTKKCLPRSRKQPDQLGLLLCDDPKSMPRTGSRSLKVSDRTQTGARLVWKRSRRCSARAKRGRTHVCDLRRG
jgi:hypothetical protein